MQIASKTAESARKSAKSGRNAAGKPRRGRPPGGLSLDHPPPPPRSVVDGAVESIQDAMAQLQVCTRKVSAMLEGGEYDDRLASHLSWLTRNMTGNLDAMRKQESAERMRLKSMTRAEEVELVKVWLDELPEQERAEIRAHLDQLGNGGGLLS